MSGDLRKVRAGEPLRIPARTYNAFIDAAQLTRRVNADVGGEQALPVAHEHLVLIRNDSGQDLPRFGVLGIDRPLIQPGAEGNDAEFRRRAALIGAAITSTTEYIGRFVIAREPIVAGQLGWAVIRGVTPTLLNVISEEHTHADTFPGQQHLRTGFTGAARILWKETGTGVKSAVIEIGPRDRDRFPARLGEATLITDRTFGWLYEWDEVRLDGDPFSGTYGQYVTPLDRLSSGGNVDRLAFNRYEAHLSVQHEQTDDGTEGFMNAGACIIPGTPEECPPERAAVPMLHPIPKGVVVEMRAERTLQGTNRFVFDALNPVVLTDMEVP